MNTSTIPRYTLKQYTRLIIAFFGVLVLLTVYQYLVLYVFNVVDTIISTSFFLALVHHLGYASIVGLICVPLFNFIENWRSRIGFKVVAGILVALLCIETVLVGYFILFLRPFGDDVENFNLSEMGSQISESWVTFVLTVLFLGFLVWLFRRMYLFTKKHYHHIGKMYPFTIILFSVFVATLFLEGKPINENKTQYALTRTFESSEQDTKESEFGDFKNNEMVWINSVFNGNNRDKAYETAKDLAYQKDYEKSLLLCRYILYKVPDHIDTKVLIGRVKAWQGNYEDSIDQLTQAISSNPNYVDAYSALFDVYYWSGQTNKAIKLVKDLNQLKLDTKQIASKIERAKKEFEEQKTKESINDQVAELNE